MLTQPTLLSLPVLLAIALAPLLGAVLAGAVGAVVAQAGGDFIGAFTVAGDQDDVGLAFVLARLQHRGDRHPGQVACVEKGALQLRLAQRATDQAQAAGAELVVAIAPALTIGFVSPSPVRSTAMTELKGRPVGSAPILA